MISAGMSQHHAGVTHQEPTVTPATDFGLDPVAEGRTTAVWRFSERCPRAG